VRTAWLRCSMRRRCHGSTRNLLNFFRGRLRPAPHAAARPGHTPRGGRPCSEKCPGSEPPDHPSAREVAQLDQASPERVTLRQPGEGRAQGQQFPIRRRRQVRSAAHAAPWVKRTLRLADRETCGQSTRCVPPVHQLFRQGAGHRALGRPTLRRPGEAAAQAAGEGVSARSRWSLAPPPRAAALPWPTLRIGRTDWLCTNSGSSAVLRRGQKPGPGRPWPRQLLLPVARSCGAHTPWAGGTRSPAACRRVRPQGHAATRVRAAAAGKQ
jgi:hypothetical protein